MNAPPIIHTVAWRIEPDNVYGAIECTAPEDGPCRQRCKQGCEVWPCDADGHTSVSGPCNGKEWIEAISDGVEAFYDGPDAPLRDGPIDLYWKDENWMWDYRRELAAGANHG